MRFALFILGLTALLWLLDLLVRALWFAREVAP